MTDEVVTLPKKRATSSWTMWFNFAVILVTEVFKQLYDLYPDVGWVIQGFAVVNMLLRLKTSLPIQIPGR